jgi:hypothetical protein
VKSGSGHAGAVSTRTAATAPGGSAGAAHVALVGDVTLAATSVVTGHSAPRSSTRV